MLPDGRVENEKLPEEPGSKRNAGERNHRDQHGEGEKRGALCEPA